MRLVVFVRGINVGGHVVKKSELQEVFTSLGFSDVSTFRQSGNITLWSVDENTRDIEEKAEAKLNQTLGYEVVAFVRSILQLQQIIVSKPFRDCAEEEADFQVTFLKSRVEPFPFRLPLRIPNSTADVISARDAEVFSITRGHGDGGKVNPFLESKLKVRATTRNWDVIREIFERSHEVQ